MNPSGWTRGRKTDTLNGLDGEGSEIPRSISPLAGRAPFGHLRDLVRKVRQTATIDLDTNSLLRPLAPDRRERPGRGACRPEIIRHAGQVVADHALCRARRERIVGRTDFAGAACFEGPVRAGPVEIAPAASLRPLAEYEAVAGRGR